LLTKGVCCANIYTCAYDQWRYTSRLKTEKERNILRNSMLIRELTDLIGEIGGVVSKNNHVLDRSGKTFEKGGLTAKCQLSNQPSRLTLSMMLRRESGPVSPAVAKNIISTSRKSYSSASGGKN